MNDVSLVNLDKDDKKANTVTSIKSFKSSFINQLKGMD